MNPAELILFFFIVPTWLASGFADWICHRASSIETTSGWKESAIHMLMFFESGMILLPVLLLEINASIIVVICAAFVIHEVTGFFDVTYAVTKRQVVVAEQFIHSFLEILPLITVLLIVSLNWGQFLALFGLGSEPPVYGLAWKFNSLPVSYFNNVMVSVTIFGFLPYAEELVRCYFARFDFVERDE